MLRWILGFFAAAVMLNGAATAGIVAPNEVCIYEHVDFGGTAMCHRLMPGMRLKLVPKIGGYMNDRASSVHVGEDVYVRLFKNPQFVGDALQLESSTARNRIDDFNDKISSMVIVPEEMYAPGVVLRKSNLGEAFYPLPERLSESEARYSNLGQMNDEALSLRIRSDSYFQTEVTLYEHANFAGKALTLQDPAPGQSSTWFILADYQFDGRASSLVVRARGPQQQVIPGQIKLPPAPPSRDSSSGVTHRAPPAPVPIESQPAKVLQLGSGLEMDTDRPGINYRSFDLDVPEPKRCQRTCQDDPKCNAWTYVKPGVQGPKARCWLKTGVPSAKPAQCCISGVKRQ
jgi:hypothetical protein